LAAVSGQAAAPASQAAAPASQAAAPGGAAGALPDAALQESLAKVQAMAQKSDGDVGRLHIDKWKTDRENKQQSQAVAESIRKNLTTAIPDLVTHLQAEPDSVIANFKLYRNLNALFDSFSALAESAGAFGPQEQYAALASDVAQMDQLRRQIAQRVETLAVSSEGELARMRAEAAAARAARAVSGRSASSKTASKIVVDDSHPAQKKKPKPSGTKPASGHPASGNAASADAGSSAPAAVANPSSAGSAPDTSQGTPKKKAKPSPYPTPQQ
jgi:hypothetical protein